MASSDDASLALAARNDPQAFAVLYDRYVVRLYAYALHQTGNPALAQDVTSATFEKALRHLHHRGWKSGSFLAWLYRIARNEAISQYRKGSRLVDLPEHAAIAQDQEANPEIDQEQVQLWNAFSHLPARDQEVLNLRFIEGLSSTDVAEILGCTLPNLYLQVHRALQRLRRELESGAGIVEMEAATNAKKAGEL
jgi:RNA polymerase sigma-70 factor (ECF subfamily)